MITGHTSKELVTTLPNSLATDVGQDAAVEVPRCGYFYTEKGCDDCFGSNGTCDKPGIGSKDFQGGDCDCPLCCTPFNLIADIICCIPITFGCWTVEKSN